MNETHYRIARECHLEVEIIERTAFGLRIGPDGRMRGRIRRFRVASSDHNGTTTYIDARDGSLWMETPAHGFGRCRCRALDRLIRAEASARRQGLSVRWRTEVDPPLDLCLIAGFGPSTWTPIVDVIKDGAVVRTIK